MVYSDGSIHHAVLDAGNTYRVDGEVVFEFVEVPNVVTRAVPSGYLPLVTNRYSASTYDAYLAGSSFVLNVLVGLGLSGLNMFAGAIGGALAGVLIDMYYDGRARGYIEVKQYYHKNTYYIYTVVSVYKYSNYTGLVDRWEYGPYPPV